ncbi:hypothetical protein PENTCL1PPCAC_19251, partial [Pristionchus entomophagus]
SLSRPIPPNGRKRKFSEEIRDYFPILALPTELISHTFSFLSMEDRMRARVNKKLNIIELESKYYVNRVLIQDRPPVVDWYYSWQQMIFSDEESYPAESLRRIAQNASIGYLQVHLRHSTELNREVYNLIKELDIVNLDLRMEEEDLANEVMVDSYLLDLMKSCKTLFLCECENITAEAIHQVYKGMIDGSSKLRKFSSILFSRETCVSFLKLIGIIYRDERFFTNRDIEAFEYKEEDDLDDSLTNSHKQTIRLIFDGFIEITVFKEASYNNCFHLKLHESRASLEKAKNDEELVRIEVNST